MDILVINTGSSSLKYQLINIETKAVLAKGLAERIGIKGSRIKYQYYKNGKESEIIVEQDINTHTDAFEVIVQLLTDKDFGVISNTDEIKAIGHRIVHGGEKFSKTQVITREVKDAINALVPLAPLHNPANIIGIEAAEKIFPSAVQVGVFDTAFHATLPEKAFRYAIPKKFYIGNQVRVYGFHGTSHKYVYDQAKKYLKSNTLKAITIHLGNGASMTAIDEKGHSIDTTLGFSPLCGLFMGTRSGDIDPGVIFYMIEQLGMSVENVKDLLYKQSGMLGLAGSSDARDVGAKYHQNDKNAILTYDMYTYRIKKYIGAYFAALNGVDAIIFTGGIGENDRLTRRLTCQNLDALGILIDEAANETNNHPSAPVEIQLAESKVKILVIPTNEELEIAEETFELMQKR